MLEIRTRIAFKTCIQCVLFFIQEPSCFSIDCKLIECITSNFYGHYFPGDLLPVLSRTSRMSMVTSTKLLKQSRSPRQAQRLRAKEAAMLVASAFASVQSRRSVPHKHVNVLQTCSDRNATQTFEKVGQPFSMYFPGSAALIPDS